MKWVTLQNFILLSDTTYAESIVLSTIRLFEDVSNEDRKRFVSGFLRDFMSRPTISLSFKNLVHKWYITNNYQIIYDRITPTLEANVKKINYYPTIPKDYVNP